MSHTVSIILVNHNAGLLLKSCVESILASESANEILVIDNASTDNSLDTLPSTDKLQIIRNPTNLGFSAACNIGIHASSGEYFLFLNPDCSLQVNTISILLDELKSDAQVGMVGGLLLNQDGSEQGGGRRAVPTPWRSFVRAFGLYRLSNRWPKLFYDFYLHKTPLPDHPVEVEAISGACMLVRSEAMDLIGLWDEHYFLHCEDLDLCMRFRQNGWKIVFVPSAKIVHALGVCSRSRPFFVEWHKHKGMIRFYRKFFIHQYPLGLMGLVIVGVWFRFGLVCMIHAGKLFKRKFGQQWRV